MTFLVWYAVDTNVSVGCAGLPCLCTGVSPLPRRAGGGSLPGALWLQRWAALGPQLIVGQVLSWLVHVSLFSNASYTPFQIVKLYKRSISQKQCCQIGREIRQSGNLAARLICQPVIVCSQKTCSFSEQLIEKSLRPLNQVLIRLNT